MKRGCAITRMIPAVLAGTLVLSPIIVFASVTVVLGGDGGDGKFCGYPIATFLAAPGPESMDPEKIEGMVVALRIDKCGMKPGTCEGSVGIGMPGTARTARVTPGTTIRKGGRVVVLQELRLGDRAVAELGSTGDVAKFIEAQ